jgi:hypothetical protein
MKAQKLKEIKAALMPKKQCFIFRYLNGKFLNKKPIDGSEDIHLNRRIITKPQENGKG